MEKRGQASEQNRLHAGKVDPNQFEVRNKLINHIVALVTVGSM